MIYINNNDISKTSFPTFLARFFSFFNRVGVVLFQPSAFKSRVFMLTYPSSASLWWSSFTHLLYPQLCVACNAALTTSANQCFCFKCRAEVDHVDFDYQQNEVLDRLWGRVHLESAASLYYFKKKSPVQWALHHLKYGNQPEIGKRLGRLLGQKLLKSPCFQGIDGIVPVPLHPLKERLRGYNQSMAFALGLAESMQAPVLGRVLVRNTFTDSQTRKHRSDRFESVGEVFSIVRPDQVKGKHLLLVDDILTTGATIEFCGNALLQAEGVRVSVAMIAVASLER